MKNFVLFLLLLFFLEGVFGESVSVTDGDSVTLRTGLTEIQEDDVLEWRFGVERDRIAIVSKDSEPTIYDDVLGGRFRGKLRPDGQTGDLTITDITSELNGTYEISINTIVSRKFSFIVVSAAPVKTVSLMVGDSVTLHLEVTEPHRYDVIQWRFKNSLIAEINRTIGKSFTSKTDEGFKGRLKLEYLTGSLTIKNTENKHSGDYEVDIISRHLTIHKSFTVTVSGVTGEMKSVSVKEGVPVTLNSGLTEIQTEDLMQWMFRDSQIAEIYKADDRFSTSDDRLKLDHQTGSLTITNTRNEDSGEYKLQISSSRRTILRRFSVTVTVIVSDPPLSAGAIAVIVIVLLMFAAAVAVGFYYRRKNSELKAWVYKMIMLSVMEGESIPLTPDDVRTGDKLVWIIRSCCIAVRESGADSFTVHDDRPDGRFKDRLKLDPQTGSLTIPKTKTTDTGDYELLIIRSGKSAIKRFRVSVFAQTDEIETVSVKEGDSVTLETGVTDVQKVEQIQWKCGLNLRLAEITRGIEKISPTAAKILEVKLDLDRKTGSLIIKKIRPTDDGIYMLRKIDERGNITTKLFRVKVDPTDFRNNSEEMPLTTVYA